MSTMPVFALKAQLDVLNKYITKLTELSNDKMITVQETNDLRRYKKAANCINKAIGYLEISTPVKVDKFVNIGDIDYKYKDGNVFYGNAWRHLYTDKENYRYILFNDKRRYIDESESAL